MISYNRVVSLFNLFVDRKRLERWADFLLTDVLYDDRETFKSILPETEYRKLENMLEDDNPCLLKLYFKK